MLEMPTVIPFARSCGGGGGGVVVRDGLKEMFTFHLL